MFYDRKTRVFLPPNTCPFTIVKHVYVSAVKRVFYPRVKRVFFLRVKHAFYPFPKNMLFSGVKAGFLHRVKHAFYSGHWHAFYPWVKRVFYSGGKTHILPHIKFHDLPQRYYISGLKNLASDLKFIQSMHLYTYNLFSYIWYSCTKWSTEYAKAK